MSFLSAEGGTRTHEANARDLKTRPFDHSGTPADSIVIKESIKWFDYLLFDNFVILSFVLRTRLELVTLAL